MARFNLAPSRLARYYFFECDRFLRYDATPRDRRTEEGIPPRQFDTSPVTRAILAGGEAWEQHVLTAYLPDAVTGAPSTDDPSDVTKRTLPYRDTVEALRTPVRVPRSTSRHCAHRGRCTTRTASTRTW